jgi:hypothetical protein
MRLGEAHVHAREIAAEDSGFVATGAGTNLDEDVFLVVGILWNEELCELGLEPLPALAQRALLLLGELAHLGICEELRVLLERVEDGAIGAIGFNGFDESRALLNERGELRLIECAGAGRC